jgi:hypothetical protein
MGRDLIDQLAQFAGQHVVQSVCSEIDAMVGDPALRKIVRPDLFRPFPGADLPATLPGDRVLLLLHLHFIEARAQHLHRLCAVLDL